MAYHNEKAESFYRSLKGRRVAFCGIGGSNLPLIRSFAEKGAKVTARDKRSREQLGALAAELEALGVSLVLGEGYLGDLTEEIVFRTPGMRFTQPELEAARALCDFDDELVVSATEGFNVDAFVELVSAHLPEGPRWFPEDMDVDASPEELVAEFVREKLFLHLRQELPHSVGVLCDEIDYADDGHASIAATILVERDGQKGIVLGRGGQMIKRVGIEARRDIERLLGCKVYLDLTVRVAPQWRRDEREIRRLGYGLEE